MKYIDSYRDEVTAFIGLDSSAPTMLDEMIMKTKHITVDELDPMPEVSDEINKQYRLIAAKVLSNKNVLEEEDLMSENFQKSKDYPLPKDLPVN